MTLLAKGRGGLAAFCFIFLSVFMAAANGEILPAPQHAEPMGSGIRLAQSTVVAITTNNAGNPQIRFAAGELRAALAGALRGLDVRMDEGGGPGAVTIHLWDFSQDSSPPVALTILDRAIVSSGRHYGQGYVLRVQDDKALWVIGGTASGVLNGAMSALQLIERTRAGASIQGIYIRDYPDFEYRAASDWLLNIEINGWTWDRGQGVEAFARTMERKLDRAARYKINMALVDGFGFAVAKRPAFYAPLWLRLNQYARARGIHLIHGGYGASYGMAYEPVVMYETGAGFKGTVFENRRGYPDGEVYRCMGFPKSRRGYDPATLGSCRSNDALNHLKAAELREYVAALEPGALYIHHEDFGGYEGTQQAWLERCEACRRRWPNDSLLAPDGGAGALAHGYSELIRAVANVKNPTTGFDGSRDTRVILVSPVYIPDQPTSESWAKVIELWRNIALQLPREGQADVCFREVFPLRDGGERFTESFAAEMRQAGVSLNTFLFFTGGADRFMTDYPLTGTPVMNSLFVGARGMYNSSGDSFQPPMELVNAEYSWNARSSAPPPRTFAGAEQMIREYAYDLNGPPEIFGTGGVYDRALKLLYGPGASEPMKKYYLEGAYLTQATRTTGTQRPMNYLPLTWDRMFAAASYWRQLVQDSKTWRGGVDDESYERAVERSKLAPAELHRRLEQRWKTASGLNRRATGLLEQALAGRPLPESVEDLEFERTLRAVYQPLIDALGPFHEAWAARLSGQGASQLGAALILARKARDMAQTAFPEPIDPVGGEIGALRKLSSQLVEAIGQFEHQAP